MKIQKYQNSFQCDIFSLWQEVFEPTWHVSQDRFCEIVFDKIIVGGSCFRWVVLEGGIVIGFVAGRVENQKGSIILLMVHPDFQKRGIGTALLKKVQQEMFVAGAKKIHLGSGVGRYFWPGIPQNLPGAKEFFLSQDWRVIEDVADMVGNIAGVQFPEITNPVEQRGVLFRTALEKDEDEIISFTERDFSTWVIHYKRELVKKRYSDILLAVEDEGIAGAVILFSKSFLWQPMFTERVGGFGALGVKKNSRGKGVGLALAARATEILSKRGCKKSFLGWTYLVDWYGKLGYKIWRKYDMCSKEI